MKTNLKAIARRLPSPLEATLRFVYRRFARWFGTSGVSAKPGPLVTEVFSRIGQIPGWFNLDDGAHFSLILGSQTAAGMKGHLLEIGCYHGRSTCLLAMHLRPGETLSVCDVFDLPRKDPYSNPPTPEILLRNLKRVVPNLSDEHVQIHRCESRDLPFDEDTFFRFAHIDGGHEIEVVLHDLRICADRMLKGGVIALDDYFHPQYPDVTEGAHLFLKERPDYQVLADLNRRGALGRKLYLCHGNAE